MLAAYDDAHIPEPVDLIFTSNTYDHLEARPTYFANARRYLRPGGRIAVVECKRHGLFQWLFPHSTEASEIQAEMEQAGYALPRRHHFLERQHCLVFEPR